MQMTQKINAFYKVYILGLSSSQQVQLIYFSVCAHYVLHVVFLVREDIRPGRGRLKDNCVHYC